MLFGDHSVVYGHPCIVTAIDQRISVVVEKHEEHVFALSAPDVGLVEYKKPKNQLGLHNVPRGVTFLETLYKVFLDRYPQNDGIFVETKSQFSSSFGFGSSSAVTVAFGRALMELYEIPFVELDLFRMCYQAVMEVQGVGSGFDIASAIWGKTIYYVKPAKVVEPLEIESIPLIVGFTGVKADTATIVRMVEELKTRKPDFVQHIFDQIEEITNLARSAISARDWRAVGQLMNQNEELLEELGVSSKELDALIGAAKDLGEAHGAKLSGAGGGDCMISLGEDKQKIEDAIAMKGGEPMNVMANAGGVRVELCE